MTANLWRSGPPFADAYATESAPGGRAMRSMRIAELSRRHRLVIGVVVTLVAVAGGATARGLLAGGDDTATESGPRLERTKAAPSSSPTVAETTVPTTTTTLAPPVSLPAPPPPTEPAPVTTEPPAPVPVDAPSADTTGYNACGRGLDELTSLSGTIALGDGEVLENFDLDGEINVEGENVVIRCGRIRTDALYAVTNPVGGDSGSFVIEHVQMIGTATDISANSAGLSPYGNWTARGIDVSRFRDGIKVGSNHTLEGSWIHDLWKTEGAHNDGVQSVGGSNVTLHGNRIEGPWRASTSAIMIAADVKPIADYTFTGNWFSGGGYTIYIGGKDHQGTPRNVTFRDNVIVDGSFTYGPFYLKLSWPEADSGAVTSGNTFDSGAPLEVG